MTSITETIIRKTVGAATILVIGGGLAYIVAPGPVTGVFNQLRDRIAWTPATCQLAPQQCLAERVPALQRRAVEVRESRAHAETGLRAIQAEEQRLTSLLEANLGQQALLRARYNEAANRGLERVNFLNRRLALGEAEAQAAALAAEQGQFETALRDRLPPQRDALTRVRQEAILMENRLATTIATAEAERALLAAGQSMRNASELLATVSGVERDASALAVQVRSTLELTQAQRSGEPGRVGDRGGFDFQAWRGQSRPAGG